MMGYPLWFYGNDPARDQDYHTIVVNGLMRKPPSGPWLPMLRDVYRYKKKDYLQVMAFLFNILFKKMPPAKYAVDETRDPTWAELLVRKLGEEKTLCYKFTTNQKLELMTINRNYLLSGYKLPNPDELIRKKAVTQEKAQILRELKQESLREQMKPISGDRISFSDGGKHNDLLHAQSLSLKAVLEYQKVNGGFGGFMPLEGFNGAGNEFEMEPTKEEQMAASVKNIMKRKSNFDKIDIKFSG